jgi:hypothetical protein
MSKTCCFLLSRLHLGALLSAPSFTSLGTEAAVAVCFAPEEDCTAFTGDAIYGAQIQILVSAYGLTSSNIVEALVRAKHRRVDVKQEETRWASNRNYGRNESTT